MVRIDPSRGGVMNAVREQSQSPGKNKYSKCVDNKKKEENIGNYKNPPLTPTSMCWALCMNSRWTASAADMLC